MSDLEQQLGDAVADDRITVADADAVRTFALFLQETPAGVRAAIKAKSPKSIAGCFATVAEFRTWRNRWWPYVIGESTEPAAGSPE